MKHEVITCDICGIVQELRPGGQDLAEISGMNIPRDHYVNYWPADCCRACKNAIVSAIEAVIQTRKPTK
jgi:hypothetical protein